MVAELARDEGRDGGDGRMSDYQPKCLDLMDAIKEVRFWIGVNMVRFEYSMGALMKLMKACLDFVDEVGDA